jgi:outer membrane lipoprotein-sorting protein
MKTSLALSAAALVLAGFSPTLPLRASGGEPKAVPDPRPILQELQRKMASVRSVYLEFTQERQLKLFADALKTKGVMLIERPDQIRWETTEPYQSILLANQKSVAQFEFEDGKWKRLRVGFPQIKRVMDQMALMHQGKIDALNADYTISATTNGMTIISLVPKDETVRGVLSSIDIHLLPDLSATREVVMHEPSGDLTRIVFGKELRDVKFPTGTFNLEKPVDIAAVMTAIGAR